MRVRVHTASACSLLLLCVSTPSHASGSAWPSDPTVNVPLCTAIGDQTAPTSCSDDSGGAIVVWVDARDQATTRWDIYVQRVSASGVTKWASLGVAICTDSAFQYSPAIVSDGSGGAIITWQDARGLNGYSDIYVQRVNASGVVQWAANGVALTTRYGGDSSPTITSDGAGGAIVTWFAGTSNIYAQRVNPAGTPLWTTDGVAICSNGLDEFATICSDGAGGAVIAWQDFRNLVSADIFAQRVNASGVTQWTTDGVLLSLSYQDAQFQSMVSDGTGGAIVVWRDLILHAQHVNSSGVPQWGTNGLPVCNTPGTHPSTLSDGSGGVFVAWQDSRGGGAGIYARHVTATGVPLWLADGVPLCTAPGGQALPVLVTDGAGGIIVAWQDLREGDSNSIFAQRVLSSGQLMWTTNGAAVSIARNDQITPTMIPSGVGHALIAWSDARVSPSDYNIYAQQIDSYGRLGEPQPVITSVADIAHDQGGWIRLRWNASYLDTLPTLNISFYGVWHQVTGEMAASALAHDGKWADASSASDIGPGMYRMDKNRGQSTWWEGVGSIPAQGQPSYTLSAQTFQDSTAAGNPFMIFMVDAHAAFVPGLWSSLPDSGYSVDNLPPLTPAPFTGQFSGGAAHLHWGLNTEADLAGYRLYRGTSSGFVPAPANLRAATLDTGYVDASGSPFYYKLAAIDAHGNLSGFTSLLPIGALDVTPPAALEFSLDPMRPNPASGRALTVRFNLPNSEAASIELLDVSGRRIAGREVGVLGAGRQTIILEPRGRLGPGLYLVRLTQGPNVRVTRVAVLD